MTGEQDTDREQAIIIKNISHRWLKEADDAMGALRSRNATGTFDLFASLDIWGYPVVSRLTAQFAKLRRGSKHKLNA